MRFDWRAVVLPVGLAVLAEIGARAHGPSDSVAPPSAVVVAFIEAFGDGSLLTATLDTLASASRASPSAERSALPWASRSARSRR
jgi:ABC-type nitrate/sulfonate/bicarbonate transport system permease component